MQIPAQSSREAILAHLHGHGQATTRELAQLLGLTPTGVRQHLALLERDGLVNALAQPGKVGRPALVYSLTDRAEAFFPKNYAMFINVLLEELRSMAGAEALQQLLRRVSARMAESYEQDGADASLPERIQRTAQALRQFGSTVETEQHDDEYLIQQFTCPYPQVARRHSAICALEVGFVQRMTGSDARLTGSLLRGDRACTYRVRPSMPSGRIRANRP